MKKTLTTLVLILTMMSPLLAQMEQHISWKFSTNKLDNNKVEIICEATLDEGWHVYSTNLPENTAIPTSITLEESADYIAVGGLIENAKPKKHYDETFGAELSWFEGSAIFKQIIELKKQGDITIKGYMESMICNDETCMPPEMVDFAVKVTNAAATTTTTRSTEAKEQATKVAEQVADVKEDKTETSAVAVNKKESDTTTESEEEQTTYWGMFLLAFAGGLAALLTPCVFPMIPMTVSFFTKQSENKAAGIRNAILYGLSIIVIYVILGTAVAAIFGADALNAMSTNPWFNIFFFVLLVVFAVSFFGAFEIVMPNSWVTFADKKSDKGGLIGIFFMAFTLALVSFSCTGPIVGSLLVQAASGGFMGPIIGMLGFSLALALPFGLFAAFPGFLNSLPKSGGWLNSVKVVLGFLELAFAFKFLSNTDMVWDLHILEREVFIAIWIAIFGALGFYLLGKIKLPHDSPMDHLPVSRLMLGLMVLSFTIYMIPGLWGAPLKLISAFPPGSDYAESPNGVGYRGSGTAGGHSFNLPEGMHPGPQGIPAFEDYDKALAYAKQVNKPLILDFTGKACVNCRKMENMVWSDQVVKGMLTNDFILVSLYVDLRKELEEPYISKTTQKKIRTVGQKWADFQLERFKQQGQPYYVLLDTNEKELNKPMAYNPDIEAYTNWLKDGLEKFKNN